MKFKGKFYPYNFELEKFFFFVKPYIKGRAIFILFTVNDEVLRCNDNSRHKSIRTKNLLVDTFGLKLEHNHQILFHRMPMKNRNKKPIIAGKGLFL